MTDEDLEKFKIYIRNRTRPGHGRDGDPSFEHSVRMKVDMYDWSLRVEPTLTIDEYLKLEKEPWLKLPKRSRKRGR